MEVINKVVNGETIARGVACALITAGQWFAMRPFAEGCVEVSVALEGVRFLPVACVAPAQPGKTDPGPAAERASAADCAA